MSLAQRPAWLSMRGARLAAKITALIVTVLIVGFGASTVFTIQRESQLLVEQSKRDLAAALRSLARMPLATMPWWKSLSVMNENKGVFGLNMLHWWDREGSIDRLVEPLMGALDKGELEPVVAGAFPFEHAPDAHRMIEERRNIGKVVLVP